MRALWIRSEPRECHFLVYSPYETWLALNKFFFKLAHAHSSFCLHAKCLMASGKINCPHFRTVCTFLWWPIVLNPGLDLSQLNPISDWRCELCSMTMCAQAFYVNWSRQSQQTYHQRPGEKSWLMYAVSINKRSDAMQILCQPLHNNCLRRSLLKIISVYII